MNKKIFKSETEIYDFWQSKNLLNASPNSSKKSFSLLIPPPNLTGELHLGHAMQHSILDSIARFKRLQGFDVLLLPGVDHAGIQFEGTFDKYLAKQNLSKQKLGREEWLKRAWKFKEEVYKSVSTSWRLMGLSADWSREVFTLDDGPRRAVFEEFKTYFDRGLIYKGPYIVQWCPKDQTAIEDVEVEYEERVEKLYFLKYGPLTLATTRPETKFGDTAMAVNPKDKRYKDYVGSEFEIETLNGKRMMKVVADDAVDPDFGTGVIKVTPGHDFADYEIGKRHNLPIIHVINKEGRLTEVAGKYAGMKVAEARGAMIPELQEKGILVKVEDYVHNIAVCERCKTVVEPIISEEWFIKVEELAGGAVKVIEENRINFLPKNYAKILRDWLLNIHDWCISRSLWWGHRLPVFYCQEIKSSKCKVQKGIIISLNQPETCPYCGSAALKQDEQVLDTWFSSGLWPLSTLGWPHYVESDSTSRGKGEDQAADFAPELKKYFPWDFEISAPEIKYLWIARMIMLSVYFTGNIPFKTMFFHGMLRDLQGRKFSKSLGNGIDPAYLTSRWGTDATRMTLYTYSVPGRDGKVSKQILDERGKNFRNFATKIRNVARFVIELKPENASSDFDVNYLNSDDDKEVIQKLDMAIWKTTNYLEKAELHLASTELYNFIWHDFADVYIEEAKKRRVEAQGVLLFVLKTTLILLHPFMPFVTEELYQMFDVREESIMLERWPSYSKLFADTKDLVGKSKGEPYKSRP